MRISRVFKVIGFLGALGVGFAGVVARSRAITVTTKKTTTKRTTTNMVTSRAITVTTKRTTTKRTTTSTWLSGTSTNRKRARHAAGPFFCSSVTAFTRYWGTAVAC